MVSMFIFVWPYILLGAVILIALHSATEGRGRILLLLPIVVSILIVILPQLLFFYGAGIQGIYIFFLGWWLSGLTAIAVFLVVYVLIVMKYEASENKTRQSRFNYLPVLLVIPISIYISLRLATGIDEKCEELHRGQGNEVILAVHRYEDKTGRFPKSIQQIVPEYLAETPQPVCLISYRLPDLIRFSNSDDQKFFLHECSNDRHILAVPIMIGAGYQRYSFSSDQWSYPSGNYLDNPDRLCSEIE
jgi:hypothetical protein